MFKIVVLSALIALVLNNCASAPLDALVDEPSAVGVHATQARNDVSAKPDDSSAFDANKDENLNTPAMVSDNVDDQSHDPDGSVDNNGQDSEVVTENPENEEAIYDNEVEDEDDENDEDSDSESESDSDSESDENEAEDADQDDEDENEHEAEAEDNGTESAEN
jgi:hypothetical protein